MRPITSSQNRCGARRPALAAAALLAVAALATAACSSDSSDDEPADTTSSTTTSATASVGPTADIAARLDAKAFAQRLGQPGVVPLDVRTPAEYADGHIAGAKNIDVQAGDFAQRVAALDKAASYAVYCRSGNRSQTAVAAMRAAGFTRVFDLVGGITAWTAEGNPVTKS